ncbi:MAG: hypothetical protein RL377_174, partial [Bacteroidota bacterium]
RSGTWASLPQFMYYRTNSTADDKTAWFNSFYVAPPSAWATTAPTGTTKITWMSSAIGTAGTTSPLGRFATGFTTGKSELLPFPQAVLDANFNLKQNPGY